MIGGVLRGVGRRTTDLAVLAANPLMPRVRPARPVIVATSPRVLFVGDSLTRGSYASADELSFRGLVATALGGEVVGVSGRSGQTAAQAVAEGLDLAEADLAVVGYGTNDVSDSTLDQFRAAYRALLDAVQAKSPGAALLCLGPWQSWSFSRAFEKVARAASEGHGATYVQISPLFALRRLHAQRGEVLPSGRVVPDSFHPNNAGHQRIADLLLRQVARST